MIYNKSNLHIDSDYTIRTLREENGDVDIIIPIEDRTINLYLNNLSTNLNSRIQFPMVKNIIIRFSAIDDSNICTVHLLKSIDIRSSVANFEVDYGNSVIDIKEKEHSVSFQIKKKN